MTIHQVKDNSLVFSADSKKTMILIPILMPDYINFALIVPNHAEVSMFNENTY